MRNHSRVGSIRTLLEESNTVPSYDGSLGHAPQGLNPKQALALDDLMNHGISRALLQLFPSARCTLPPGLHHQEHNSGVVASTSPLRGTRHPSAISRKYTEKLWSSKQSSTHTAQLRLYSCCRQCDDTASAGPPLQGEGDLRGSETAPGLWGPWDRLGPPQSPSHPGAAQPAHTRMVHSLPMSGSHHRPRLCPWCQGAEGWGRPWDNTGC